MANKRATRQEVILEVWHSLESQSAGELELKTIQARLQEAFGTGGVESPARIARTLADADVNLRHPEVLEFDARWRESRLYALFGPDELIFDNLNDAIESVGKIRDLGEQFESEGDEDGMKGLAEYVKRLRSELEAGRPANSLRREVVEWLRIWLQNPTIFSDWLDLRLKSPNFCDKIGT